MPEEQWYGDGLKFSCTQCGNCCTGPPGYVWFSPAEAKAIAAYLKLDLATFHRDYAHKAFDRWSLNEHETEHGYDCIFLKRSQEGKIMCSIYPVRPAQCRTWPFWPENTQKPSDWRRAAKTCPGIDHGNFYPAQQIRILRDNSTGHTDHG